MRQLWRQVDQLLRGREVALADEALQDVDVSYLALGIVILAAVYGFFMGWYALFSRAEPEWRQIVADACKMPTLFLMTLLICFPSLYVFSVLLGSRLAFTQMLRVMLAIVAITVAVLASFGPIVGFFALSTDNHPFMVLLNVAFCAVSGILGVGILWRALRVLLSSRSVSTSPELPPVIGAAFAGEADRQVRTLFRVWMLICAVVGAQMGWVLRPFISDPHAPFVWLCDKEGNFFLGVWHATAALLQ